MPLPREKAKCHHQTLEGVGEWTVWLELNLGNLRRLQGISQWVTQNPKATITSPAAATLPELLSAIPALLLWEKPRGEGPDPSCPKAAPVWERNPGFHPLGKKRVWNAVGWAVQQGGRGSDINRAKKSQ